MYQKKHADIYAGEVANQGCQVGGAHRAQAEAWPSMCWKVFRHTGAARKGVVASAKAHGYMSDGVCVVAGSAPNHEEKRRFQCGPRGTIADSIRCRNRSIDATISLSVLWCIVISPISAQRAGIEPL